MRGIPTVTEHKAVGVIIEDFVERLIDFQIGIDIGAGEVVGLGGSDQEVDAPFNQAFNDSASGFMIGYGWDTPHSWLSVEMTYTDFGDSDKTISDSYTYYDYDITETLNGKYEGKALDLWLVARFSPVNITKTRPLNIVPRVGLTAASSRGSLNYREVVSVEGDVMYDQSARVSASDSGIGYAYGIGLEVASVVKNVDIFVDWRKHEVEMVYAGQVVDFDPSSIQAGVNWHF